MDEDRDSDQGDAEDHDEEHGGDDEIGIRPPVAQTRDLRLSALKHTFDEAIDQFLSGEVQQPDDLAGIVNTFIVSSLAANAPRSAQPAMTIDDLLVHQMQEDEEGPASDPEDIVASLQPLLDALIEAMIPHQAMRTLQAQAISEAPAVLASRFDAVLSTCAQGSAEQQMLQAQKDWFVGKTFSLPNCLAWSNTMARCALVTLAKHWQAERKVLFMQAMKKGGDAKLRLNYMAMMLPLELILWGAAQRPQINIERLVTSKAPAVAAKRRELMPHFDMDWARLKDAAHTSVETASAECQQKAPQAGSYAYASAYLSYLHRRLATGELRVLSDADHVVDGHNLAQGVPERLRAGVRAQAAAELTRLRTGKWHPSSLESTRDVKGRPFCVPLGLLYD
jgi:hypothetical protein